jgi:hypothetical protein
MNLHARVPSRARRLLGGATLAVIAASVSVVGVPGRAEAEPPTVHGCPYETLCVFQDKDWKHKIGDNLYDCGFIDLRGKSGYNKISSYVNNQTAGTVSRFYDIVNGAWKEILNERALGYRQNLDLDTGFDGKNMNDRIKGIRVC